MVLVCWDRVLRSLVVLPELGRRVEVVSTSAKNPQAILVLCLWIEIERLAAPAGLDGYGDMVLRDSRSRHVSVNTCVLTGDDERRALSQSPGSRNGPLICKKHIYFFVATCSERPVSCVDLSALSECRVPSRVQSFRTPLPPGTGSLE